MGILSNIFGKKHVQVDLERAIELFKAHPAKYFTYFDKPSEWPVKEATFNASSSPIFPNDVVVRAFSHTLGFVEGVEIKGDTATIRHIAVERTLTGVRSKKYGIGPILARAYATELNARYGVVQIIFSESHSDYDNAGYAKFFPAIGAIPLPINLSTTKPGRPDFLWPRAAW